MNSFRSPKSIVLAVYELELDQEAEMKRHNETMETLRHRLSEIEKSCAHKLTNFQIDPAGGPSTEYCELCGKIL